MNRSPHNLTDSTVAGSLLALAIASALASPGRQIGAGQRRADEREAIKRSRQTELYANTPKR